MNPIITRQPKHEEGDRDEEEEEDDPNDEHDVDRIFRKLKSRPAHLQYPDLIARCRPIVQLWNDSYATSLPKFWKRTRRNLPKELNESVFILEEMIHLVENYEKEEPLTILDMCSGIGYLSMFLSHLLPTEKVSRIVPIDILFRSHEDKGHKEDDEEDRKHLSTIHLRSSIHPIEIRPRRANIKSGRELRQIAHYCIEQAPEPVIILGVHLCKALSVHTVRLFNTSSKASRLYLKPCCLPGRKDVKRRDPPFWTFEHMEGGGFGLQTLYCSRVSDESKKENEDDDLNLAKAKKDARLLKVTEGGGEEEADGKNHSGVEGKRGTALFTKWVHLLCDAADTGIEGTKVEIHHSSVQKHHFQNQYVVASRC